MKRVKWAQIAVFAAMSLLVVCFIFGNSLESRAESSQRSNRIVELLEPILGPLFDHSEEKLSVFVRKTAHVLEFAALGFCLAGLADGCWRRFWKRKTVVLPLLAVLVVAGADEVIQSFNDRACMAGDVVLDFFGGLFGLAVCCVAFEVIRARLKKRGFHYG